MSLGLLDAVARRRSGRRDIPVGLEAIRDRLCELVEEQVLNFFWLTVKRGGAHLDRLALLLVLSDVIVPRANDWNPAAVREAYEQEAEERLAKDRCFACQAIHEALYFHHVVEVQHGGSNAVRNRVPLCFPCHRYLHPWLEDARTPTSGLTPLREIAKDVIHLRDDPDPHANRG